MVCRETVKGIKDLDQGHVLSGLVTTTLASWFARLCLAQLCLLLGMLSLQVQRGNTTGSDDSSPAPPAITSLPAGTYFVGLEAG